MQVRTGLDLEGRLLAVMQERRRQPEPSPVLVDDLGGGARAGEEAGVEVRELGHERPAGDDARCARLNGGAREVEGVHARRSRAGRGRWGACPRGRSAQGAGRPSPPSARQMPREVMATTRASTASRATAMTTVDDEAGEPGGGVGALQSVLLAGRAEDAAESVDHEVDAQQQGDGGQHQRRRPEVAAQPAVEQARGHEPARQPGVVEALHAGEPGTLVGRRGVDGRVGVGPHGAGTNQHGAGCPRPSRRRGRSQSRTVTPQRSRAADQLGVPLGGHHGDDLRVVAGREGTERAGELRVAAQGSRRRRRRRGSSARPGGRRG